MKRLLIVADHSFVVHTIRLALRQTAGFQVVGFADGRASVGAQVSAARPDIVLVDDMQDPEQAIARLHEVADVTPEAQCLVLTLDRDPAWTDRLFRAGAEAVLSKTVHPIALGTLLREISHGNVIHRPRTVEPVVEQECPLTDRELEVLRLVAEGQTNNRIARQLWVTEQTVKFHLSNTYRKLGVANRTEASRYAHVHELIPQREQLAS